MALVCALVAWVMPAAAQEAAPAAPIDEAPKREQAVIGEESEALEILKAVYKPVLSFELGRMTLDFPLSIAERVETVSGFDVDADGTRFEADPTFNTQLRAGARLDSQRALSPVRLSVNVEVDIFTGQHQGGSELDGVFVPDGGELDTVVRKANGQLDFGPFVHVAGGLMTSHWGMGLVANDGAHGWEHGTAFFVDPRDGDLVLRGMMALGPFWDDGLVLAFGMDRVQSDDIMLEGDQAFQVFASAIYGQNAPAGFGFYAVSRNQDATDGDSLDVVALDFTAHGRWGLSGGSWLKLETELAVITGTTTLAPSPDFPEHDVSQFAWAGRATVTSMVARAVIRSPPDCASL